MSAVGEIRTNRGPDRDMRLEHVQEALKFPNIRLIEVENAGKYLCFAVEYGWLKMMMMGDEQDCQQRPKKTLIHVDGTSTQ